MSEEDADRIPRRDVVVAPLEREITEQVPIESPQMKQRRQAWVNRARHFQRENGRED